MLVSGVLVVNAKGTMGASYGDAVKMIVQEGDTEIAKRVRVDLV